MLGIGEMYRCSNRISSCGIEGYHIEKKYQDTNRAPKEGKDRVSQKEQAKRRQSKKGHYLEDYAKIHGDIPGPGVYECEADIWKKYEKSSKKKIKPSKKCTFIEEIMEREKKLNQPAPGQYKLFKTDKEITAEKKRLANRKVNIGDRCTYLDAVQYQATTTPGVGSYNPFSRPKSATLLTKHKASSNISRPSSATKRKQRHPEIGSYNPKTVEDHKSFAKKSKGYHQWGRVERFRSEKKGSNLGPGAYAFDEKIVAKKNSKSVYYN